MNKPWYTSKTIWFNLIVSALAALEASLHFVQPMLPVNVYGIIAVVLAVGNAALRIISTSQLTFKKEQ